MKPATKHDAARSGANRPPIRATRSGRQRGCYEPRRNSKHSDRVFRTCKLLDMTPVEQQQNAHD